MGDEVLMLRVWRLWFDVEEFLFVYCSPLFTDLKVVELLALSKDSASEAVEALASIRRVKVG